jgi:3-hydroxyisobutyrate dehydrogenase-like beta-hydroxyacid dehydrogenase
MAAVGLLFPGEMGAQIGRAAAGDVLWASEGRSNATAERAASAGFRDVGTLARLVVESDIVISLCPPAVAEDVARTVRDHGFHGLYLEGNAIAPARCERIAALLAEADARVVDGAVIGSNQLRLYLSGDPDQVTRAAQLFADSDVTTIALPGPIGAASALKMAFGGWNKAGIALAAQALAIARAYGVDDALADVGVDSERVVRAGAKAWRWTPEMLEVADTCAQLGVPDGLARGAADVFSRWASRRDQPAELNELLNDLSHKEPDAPPR